MTTSPQSDHEKPSLSRHQMLFVVAIALLTLTRMWLTADEDILARYAVYDDLWYIRSAEVGYWGIEKYNQLSAMRPPLYPLWIWANMNLGIPQRIAIDGAFVASAMLLAYALWRVGMPRILAILSFAIIAFAPEPFRLFRLIQSDALNVPLMTALCASLLLVYQSRGAIAWAMLAGFIAGLFALTRGEGSVLGTTAIAITGGLLALGAWQSRGGIKPAIWIGARAVLLPLVVLLAITHAVKVANYRTFGVYATNELSAPGHAGMMKALTRIRPPEAIDYVTITRGTLEMAYAASPSLRELQPFLDGKVTQRWHNVTRQRRAELPEGEILAGFTHWAIREAAYAAGKHTSGRDADAFYQQIADEINAAINDGRLRGRVVLSSYLDPEISRWLPRLPGSLLSIWQATYQDPVSLPVAMDAVEVPPRIAAEFDAVCLRRPELQQQAMATITGEIITPGRAVRELRITNRNGLVSLATAKLHRPARRTATSQPVQRTGFSVQVPRATSTMPIQWRVVLSDSSVHHIPRTMPGTPHAFDIPGLPGAKLRIADAEYRVPEPGVRLQIHRWLASAYHYIIPGIVYAGVAIGALALVLRRARVDRLWLSCVLLLAFAVLARFGLFAIIDASSWHGDQPRYIFPAVPAMLACAMLLISGGIREIRSLFSKVSSEGSRDPAMAGEADV